MAVDLSFGVVAGSISKIRLFTCEALFELSSRDVPRLLPALFVATMQYL